MIVFFNVILSIFIMIGVNDVWAKIVIATSADYKPFEYYDGNDIVGFDIDLIKAIMYEIGEEYDIVDTQFSSIFPSINAKHADIAISSITATDERKNNFDFSDTYYKSTMAVLHKKTTKIEKNEDMKNIKVGCQIGSVMHIWAKNNIPEDNIIAIDNISKAKSMLDNGQIECIILDHAQAKKIQDKFLIYTIENNNGEYSVMLKKGNDSLKNRINSAIKKLKQCGKIKEIEKKWLSDNHEGNN